MQAAMNELNYFITTAIALHASYSVPSHALLRVIFDHNFRLKIRYLYSVFLHMIIFTNVHQFVHLFPW